VNELQIGGRRVGPGHPCFIIAEAGVNHDGDIAVAHGLIEHAKAVGADAVKFQSFNPDELVSPSAPAAPYQRRPNRDDGQYDLLLALALPAAAWRELSEHAEAVGLVFLCTAFDRTSTDVLVDLGVAALKVPSGELDNLDFIADLGSRDLPLIISTGMGTEEEVHAAVAAAANAPGIVLLHCVSAYPAPTASSNLRAIPAMAATFGHPVGWSDHTIGSTTAVAAVALGAVMLEKHLTLDRSRSGPDHAASADPEQLRRYIDEVRNAESALGDGNKRVTEAEQENRLLVRRSYHARLDLVPGDRLTADTVTLLRPAVGLPPDTDVNGLVIARAVGARQPIMGADVVARDNR
jgi:N-acetylneuraminate synthase/N,N'-diacetyllegionaminate synthase